jgi:hypothetical protein
MSNYEAQLLQLIKDISLRIKELEHICADNIAISFKKTRSDSEYGTWAEVSGLEWKNNCLCIRNGRMERYFITDPFFINGNPVKYHIEFYMPRFINLSFREKLITVFHELYHINPKFNGGLRLFPGKNYMHGKSVKDYDDHMAVLVDRYLGMKPDDYVGFLEPNFEQLTEKAGGILKPTRYSLPKPTIFRMTLY